MRSTSTRAARLASRMGLWVVACIGAAVIVAGCGSSSKTSSTAASSASAPASGVSEAKALLDKAGRPLKWTAPGKPFDGSKVRGKRVALVSVDNRIPLIAGAAQGAKEAAAALGLQFNLVDAQSNPSAMVQGVTNGIRQADAIILDGIPIELIQKQLAAAARAKVPVVNVFNNPVDLSAPGQGAGPNVYANVAENPITSGKIAAARAVVQTGGKARVAIFTTTEITPAKFAVQGMKEQLATCGGCKVVKTIDTPLAQWSTALSAKAAALVRSDPTINYVLPIFDGMANFVVAGLSQAGASGKVASSSSDATAAALKLIQTGDIFVGDDGLPPAWVGWQAIDEAARGILGLQPSNGDLPVRALSKDNLNGVDVNNEIQLYGNVGYREGLKKLWGIG